jgi:hypothetical protein
MNRSKSFVTGLAISGLLALGDIATPLLSDGEHPPVAIGVVIAIIGLLTVVGIVLAWRGRRGGPTTIIVTRLLSALTSVPAFFADGVSAAAKVGAAVGVVLTLVAIVLIAPRLRTTTTATAPASS